MKKTFLLLVFGLFAANSAFAQRDNFYSILFQENPGYYHALYNTMQQRDGDFVINTFIFEDTGNPEMADPVGNMFYKVSSATLAITDSLFVADPVQKAYVFARDPRGDGNIKATFDYHEECDSTFLRISHFPDYDLNVDHDEDIMVSICEGQAFVDFNGHIVDCHGDLIIKYYMERPDGTYDDYIVRIDREESNESVTVVKMDTDLNVEWKRLCKTADIIPSYPFELSAVYEDDTNEEKGIVWSGYAWKADNIDKSGLLHFFLNHDGTVGTNEGGIEVRPYTYYPNPAQDRLRLQYSPDVQPKLVELYDLQGRLVRTQRQGLESLDMSQLPTGIYTMRVTMEDGQTFSDKVVKE